jgi:hypothetical protein
MRARDRLAQDLAECRQRREQGEQCDRDRVIAEFGDDPQRLADEILRHRCVLKHLAQALAWAAQGESFGLIAPGPHLGLSRRSRAAGVPSSHESDGEQADVRDL